MASQHRNPLHGFRPDPGEYEEARARLEARGHTVGVYLRACLRWLVRDPDAALATLAGDWPGPRPYGRPISSAAPNGSGGHPAGGAADAGGSAPRLTVRLTAAQRQVVQWRFLDNDDAAGIVLEGAAMDFPVDRQGYIVETLAYFADLLAHNMDRDTVGELRATRTLLRKVREAK